MSERVKEMTTDRALARIIELARLYGRHALTEDDLRSEVRKVLNGHYSAGYREGADDERSWP